MPYLQYLRDLLAGDHERRSQAVLLQPTFHRLVGGWVGGWVADSARLTVHVDTALLEAFLTHIHILCTISAIYNQECIHNFRATSFDSLKIKYEVDWLQRDNENVSIL